MFDFRLAGSEAWLLEEALRSARAATVAVTVHPRFGHALAGGLKAEGKLQALLRELISPSQL